MPRKRMVDPAIWRSKSFRALSSDAARMGFMALFSLADDEGKGRVGDWAEALEFSDLDEIGSLCWEYQQARMCYFYWVNEGMDQYFVYMLPKWFKYQYVQKPSPSKIPNHPNWRQIVPELYQKKYEKVDWDQASLIPFTEPIHGIESRKSFTEATEAGVPHRVSADSVRGVREGVTTEGKGREGSTYVTQYPIIPSSHPHGTVRTARTVPETATATSDRVKKGGNGAPPRPHFEQIWGWWEKLTFIPEAGRGKPLASQRKTAEEMEAIRQEMQDMGAVLGTEVMISRAEEYYLSVGRSQQPATLNYFLGMWRQMLDAGRKRRIEAEQEGEYWRAVHETPQSDPVRVGEYLKEMKAQIEADMPKKEDAAEGSE